MKLSKLLIILLVVIISSGLFFYFLINQKKSLNPISNQNNFYQELNSAIQTSQLNISSLKIRDFNNEVEFYILNDTTQTKVIISTQKNPFWQVSSLQQIIKTAKIKQQGLKLVDLSSDHPYATFKNN